MATDVLLDVRFEYTDDKAKYMLLPDAPNNTLVDRLRAELHVLHFPTPKKDNVLRAPPRSIRFFWIVDRKNVLVRSLCDFALKADKTLRRQLDIEHIIVEAKNISRTKVVRLQRRVAAPGVWPDAPTRRSCSPPSDGRTLLATSLRPSLRSSNQSPLPSARNSSPIWGNKSRAMRRERTRSLSPTIRKMNRDHMEKLNKTLSALRRLSGSLQADENDLNRGGTASTEPAFSTPSLEMAMNTSQDLPTAPHTVLPDGGVLSPSSSSCSLHTAISEALSALADAQKESSLDAKPGVPKSPFSSQSSPSEETQVERMVNAPLSPLSEHSSSDAIIPSRDSTQATAPNWNLVQAYQDIGGQITVLKAEQAAIVTELRGNKCKLFPDISDEMNVADQGQREVSAHPGSDSELARSREHESQTTRLLEAERGRVAKIEKELEESKRRNELLERSLRDEAHHRRLAEDALADVQRECKVPFVVGMLAKAFEDVSRLTTEAMLQQ